MIYSWSPIPSPAGPALMGRLCLILDSWDRTPYRPGMQSRGQGVDCVRFVCAVLDEMAGGPIRDPKTLPQDVAFHSRAGAISSMRKIRRGFLPLTIVRDGAFQPGDVIVAGPIDGGPGHALIVGTKRNEVWHATHLRVMRTGLSFLLNDQKVFRVYRKADRMTAWAS